MLSFRASARGLVVPLIGALLLCALCLQLVPFQTDTGVDRAAGQWLHLPGLLLVAAVLGAALEGWPLFSRARPGFTWILRVENRPLHGCLAAALGSMAALAVALTLALVVRYAPHRARRRPGGRTASNIRAASATAPIPRQQAGHPRVPHR